MFMKTFHKKLIDSPNANKNSYEEEQSVAPLLNETVQIRPDKEESILETLINVAPIFQQLVPLDCMIGITDKKSFIGYIPGNEIKTPIDILGMNVPEGDAIYKAIHTGQTARVTVTNEGELGVPYKSTGIPVRNKKGEIIGGIGLAISLNTQEALVEVAQTVAATSQQILATSEELSSSAELLAKYQDDLKVIGEQMLEQVKETDVILSFINQVATNSKLLGLNAAIEAARAGEHGRGFSVVAEEIRKMSTSSANSVTDIKNTLNSVNERVIQMMEKISEVSAIGKQQAESTQEISAAMQELASFTDQIESIAQII